MTALALTPQPATASVLLSITGAPAGPVTITRVDANGAAVVLLQAGQDPISGTLIVSDYAPALSGVIRYDVTDSAGAITSATVTLGLSTTIVHAVVLPQHRVTPELVLSVDLESPGTAIAHEVIGRTDWLINLGGLRPGRGTISLLCTTHAAAEALTALAGLGEVLQLRQSTHPGLDAYVAVEGAHIRSAEACAWIVDLRVITTTAPAGPLLGAAGWTCEALAALPNCATVTATYATCADLLVGPL